jgi:hypothetical protein
LLSCSVNSMVSSAAHVAIQSFHPMIASGVRGLCEAVKATS